LSSAKASGLVSLSGAKIGGDFNCANGTFQNRTEAGEGIALGAGNAEIGHDCVLENAKVSGQVTLMSSKIGGDFNCIDSVFGNRTVNGDGTALNFERAEIDGIVFFRGAQSKVSGQVALAGAKIRGDLDCAGATFENRTAAGDGVALTANNAEIGRDCILQNSKISGLVSLISAKIRDNFNCTDATFDNRTERGERDALNVQRAEIGGAVLLRGPNFKASGQVDLEGARIGNDLDCERATFENSSRDGKANAFTAVHTEFGAAVLFRRIVSIGAVTLAGAKIGRDLDLRGARLLSPYWYAIRAPGLRVGGYFYLGPSLVLGDLELSYLEVVRGLDWTRLRLPPECTHNSASYQARSALSRLNLSHSNLGAELRAERLTSNVMFEIDLGSTRVATLRDRWPAGWGGDQSDPNRVSLNLDGFAYDRIAHLGEQKAQLDLAASATARVKQLPHRFVALARRAPLLLAGAYARRRRVAPHSVAPSSNSSVRVRTTPPRFSVKARLEWLNLQREGEFFPQPYRHLGRVLRAHGHQGAAREVEIKERSLAPAGFFYRHVVRPLFRWGFGFGLSPGNASITLVAFILAGWLGTLSWTPKMRQVAKVEPCP